MNTPTPETDKYFALRNGATNLWLTEDLIFCRGLERERDEARKELSDSLTRWTPLRAAILKPANCGVAGHFAFQENGGHCMQCQCLNTVKAERDQLRKVCDELANQLEALDYGEGDFQGTAIRKSLFAHSQLPHVKAKGKG
jgi:hypothetical protein